MAYFLIKGSQIFQLFNSSLLHSDYSLFLNQKWTVPLLFLFDQSVNLSYYLRLLTFIDNPSKFIYNLLLIIARQTPNVPFRFMVYYKYLTWKALQDIEKESSTLSSRTIVAKVAQLAALNQQLNRLFSLPLLALAIFFSLQLLVFLTVVLLNQFAFNNFNFFIPTVLCVFGICYLCKQIDFSVKRLSGAQDCNCSKGLVVVKDTKLSVTKPTLPMAIIQLGHLHFIYGCYLQPQIFSLFTFNSTFLILLTFLLLNYAVLLHQTK